MISEVQNKNRKLIEIKKIKDVDGSSWKNLSTALETDAKLYGFRVDSVFNEVYKVLGGLNRGLKENETNIQEGSNFIGKIMNFEIDNEETADKEKINIESPLRRKKTQHNNQQTKFLETNIDHLNFELFDLEFEVDPLLEKNSAKFDEGGSIGLLINSLFVNLNFK